MMKKTIFENAQVDWPSLEGDRLTVGDIVTDEIDRPGQKGTVTEVNDDLSCTVNWGGDDIQEYGELESIFLAKVQK